MKFSNAFIVSLCCIFYSTAEKHQKKSYLTVYKEGRQKVSVAVTVDVDAETVFSRPVTESRSVLETLHDFKKNIAAYRSSDDDACYLEKLQLTSLEQELELLEKFKGVLIRQPAKTLFVSNQTTSDDILPIGGSRTQEFCGGRRVHWLVEPKPEDQYSGSVRQKRSVDHMPRSVKRRFQGQVQAHASPSSDGSAGPDVFAIASPDAAVVRVGGGTGFAQANSHVTTETEYEHGKAFRQVSASSSMSSSGGTRRGSTLGSLTNTQAGSLQKGTQIEMLPSASGSFKGFSSHELMSTPLQPSSLGIGQGASQISGSSYSSFSSGSFGQSGLGLMNQVFPSSSFFTSSAKAFQVPTTGGPIPQDAEVSQTPGSPYKTYQWKVKHPNGYQTTHWYTGPVGPDNKPINIMGPVESSPLEITVPNFQGSRRTIAGGYAAGGGDLRTVGIGLSQTDSAAERAHEQTQSLFSSIFGHQTKLFGEASNSERASNPDEPSTSQHNPQPTNEKPVATTAQPKQSLIGHQEQEYRSHTASITKAASEGQLQHSPASQEQGTQPAYLQREQEHRRTHERRLDQHRQVQDHQEQYLNQRETSSSRSQVVSKHINTPSSRYPSSLSEHPAQPNYNRDQNQGGTTHGMQEQTIVQKAAFLVGSEGQSYPVQHRPQQPLQDIQPLPAPRQNPGIQPAHFQPSNQVRVQETVRQTVLQPLQEIQPLPSQRQNPGIQPAHFQPSSQVRVQETVHQTVLETGQEELRGKQTLPHLLRTQVEQNQRQNLEVNIQREDDISEGRLNDKMLMGQREESLNTMLHIMGSDKKPGSQPHAVPQHVDQSHIILQPHDQHASRGDENQRVTVYQQQANVHSTDNINERRPTLPGVVHVRELTHASQETPHSDNSRLGSQGSAVHQEHRQHLVQTASRPVVESAPSGRITVTQQGFSGASHNLYPGHSHNQESVQSQQEDDQRERQFQEQQLQEQQLQHEEMLRQRQREKELELLRQHELQQQHQETLRHQQIEQQQEMLKQQELEQQHQEFVRQQELEQQRHEMIRQQQLEQQRQELLRQQETEQKRQELLRQQQLEQQRQEILRQQQLEQQRQEILRQQEAERNRLEMVRQQELEKRRIEMLRQQEIEEQRRQQELQRQREQEQERIRHEELQKQHQETLRRQQIEQQRQEMLRKQEEEHKRQELVRKQEIERQRQEKLHQQQLEQQRRELVRRQELEQERLRKQQLEQEQQEKLKRQQYEQELLRQQTLEQEMQEQRRQEHAYWQQQQAIQQTQAGNVNGGRLIPSGRADIPPEHDHEGQIYVGPVEGGTSSSPRPVRPTHKEPSRPVVTTISTTTTLKPEDTQEEDYDISAEVGKSEEDYIKPCNGQEDDDEGCGFSLSGSSTIVSQVHNPNQDSSGYGHQSSAGGHRRIIKFYRTSQTMQSSSGTRPTFAQASAPITSSSSQCSSYGYTCKTVYGPYERKKICTPVPTTCSSCSSCN